MPDNFNPKMKQLFSNIRKDFNRPSPVEEDDEEEKRRKEEERRRKLQALQKIGAKKTPTMDQFFSNVKKDFK
jgi:hypothetical protein